MNHLFVDVSKIIDKPGEELPFNGQVKLEPTKLGEELIEFPSASDLSVKLQGVSRGVMIVGEAVGRIRLRCGRCLKRFDYQEDLNIRELASVDETLVAKDEVFPIIDGKIDLAAVLYQNVIVEIPMQPLCRDVCAGLCSECGKNLNEEPHDHVKEEIDERLAALKRYRKSQGS